MTNDQLSDSLGWLYEAEPIDGTDARKLVTLVEGGMEWVGIRIWNSFKGRWYNGNEPERAHVKAWQDLPATARRSWVRGQLLPELIEGQENEDG